MAARARMTRQTITVEVVYAGADVQIMEPVRLAQGATVAHAIAASRVLVLHPEIDLSRQAVGIFGARVRLTDVVADGDRVEIYRPLRVDPKEMRRARARAHRGKSERARRR
jgi:putative ubiquitin-RnfH superfamily antitoxin RatB of RatAB toxin-antitoxin module